MDSQKTITTILLICLAMATVRASAQCRQDLSTTGTEFVIGILGPTNQYATNVIITTEEAADVRMIVPFANIDKHYTFKQITTVIIPANLAQMTNGTEFKGIEILSNVSISVAVINAAYWEGFLALPTKALSTKYIAASYSPISSTYHSEVLVVGIKESANVTIELPQIYKANHYSGVINVQLQKYETYQFLGIYDLSGVIINSDKPVAVFSGSSYSKIPAGIGGGWNLVEQMIPVDLWNYAYIIPPLYPRLGYLIKVFASEDNTEISYSNATNHVLTYLNETSHLELLFGKGSTIVTANKPINIVIYGYTFNGDGTSGGPCMITAQATSQFQSKYVFRTHPSIPLHTLAITIKLKDLPGLHLDGNNSQIQTAIYVPVPQPMNEYINVFLNISVNTSHVLEHVTNAPFGAILYGFQSNVGYGYQLHLTFTYTGCNATVPETTTSTGHKVTSSQPSHGNLMTTSQTSHGNEHHTYYNATGNATRCFSCDDMTHLKYCDRVKTCDNPNEVCFVQNYAKISGLRYYKSGCMDKSKCQESLQTECTKCCSGSFCNTFGCGDDGIYAVEHRGPLCFDCQYLGEHDQCEAVKLCSSTQVCQVETFMWGDDYQYTMGCSDSKCRASKRAQPENNGEDVIGTGSSNSGRRTISTRNAPVCSHCCSSDFCNTNCTREYSPVIFG